MKNLIIRIQSQKLIEQIRTDARKRGMTAREYCAEVLEAWFAYQESQKIQTEMQIEILEKAAMIYHGQKKP